MRMLVTGGAGFLGSHVAWHLVAANHDVVVLDDLSGGIDSQVPAGARLIVGSITDEAVVARTFAEGRFDHVYHLAAYAAEGLSHHVRRFNYEQNVVGSANLINEAIRREVGRFVFTSSIAVYGSAQVPMHEDMTPRPEDPYGIAKFAVELDLAAAQRYYGLDFVVLRPHNVYGEHQNITDPYRNVIGIFMRQALRGEPLTVFGDGTQTRAFTHVDDVAPQIVAAGMAAQASGRAINVGADEPCTVIDLASMVSDAFGVPLRVNHLPPRHEVVHAFAGHDVAKRLLNAEARVPLREGIARMAEWVRRNPDRAQSATPAIEISRRLPAAWSKSTQS
jgi:UDP-glucose 4-epimerase